MRLSLISAMACAAVLACGLPAQAAPLEAQGDFNGDGAVDRVTLESRAVDTVLVFDLGGGQFKRKSLIGYNINVADIATAGRGEAFSAACLRGVGKDCKESADTRVVLENDGVVVSKAEASSTLFYLKGGTIRSLTISD